MPTSDESLRDKSILVNRKALYDVLTALVGPDHLIRELQVIRGLPGPVDSPIDVLISQYNAVVMMEAEVQKVESQIGTETKIKVGAKAEAEAEAETGRVRLSPTCRASGLIHALRRYMYTRGDLPVYLNGTDWVLPIGLVHRKEVKNKEGVVELPEMFAITISNFLSGEAQERPEGDLIKEPSYSADVEKEEGLWKQVLIDEVSNCSIYRTAHENNPQLALSDLVAWHMEVALDPVVSDRAQALIDKGRQMKDKNEENNEENSKDERWGMRDEG